MEDDQLKGEADVKAQYSVYIEDEELDGVRYKLDEVKKWGEKDLIGYDAVIWFDKGRYSTPFELRFNKIEDLADFMQLLNELMSKWALLNSQLPKGDKEC